MMPILETFEGDLATLCCKDMQTWLRTNTAGRIYALINFGQCSAGAVLAIKALCEEHAMEATALFANTAEQDYADTGPHLLAVPLGAPHAVLQQLALHAATQSALSLIASALPYYKLVGHLRSWLDGVLEADPETSVLVRHFDPRIGFELVRLLPKEERTSFMQAMQWWASWDADFKTTRIAGTPAQKSGERTSPLSIDEALLEKLSEHSQADLLLGLVIEEELDGEELDHIAPALQRYITRQQLAQVRAAELTQWADKRFWVSMGLRINPLIGQTADGKKWLQLAASQGRPLTAFIPNLPTDFIATMKSRAEQDWASAATALLTHIQTQQSL